MFWWLQVKNLTNFDIITILSFFVIINWCISSERYVKRHVIQLSCESVSASRCKCMEGKINKTGIYVHCHTSILQVYMLSIHVYFYIIPAYNQPKKLSISKTKWMMMFRNIAWSQPSSRWYRTPPYCGVLQIEIIQ